MSQLTRKQKLDQLVNTAFYGIQWAQDSEKSGYVDGAIETVAFQISCCLCQWFGFSGVPACETRDFLDLENLKTKNQLRKCINKYIKLLQKEKEKKSI